MMSIVSMEKFSTSGAGSSSGATRKKRSNLPRRPRPDPKPVVGYNYVFPSDSSPNDNGRYGEINSFYQNDTEYHQDGLKDLSFESDHLGNENRLKKVKLKVGGVTRTIHTEPASEIVLACRSFKDLTGNGYSSVKESSSRGKTNEESAARKSKRVRKKRSLGEGFDDDSSDEEIRYLEKLRASKFASDNGSNQEEGNRKLKILKVSGIDSGDTGSYASSGFGEDGKKKPRIDEDNDYAEEEDPISDDELGEKRKRPRKGYIDSLMGSGQQELTITTRKRALQYGRDASPGSGGNTLEFPNGLPAASSKKQKAILPEVEQQLRKAEAAQRRRMQAQKAAKEAEAEAIRKILGQDTNRKKKEGKLKKQQEELAQERNAKAAEVGPNTIRLIMDPSGTTVTFSEDIGLPRIFNSVPCRYPPAREKCVGPNCTNTYKYRDSKSNLPLCSLKCYKAVQGDMKLLPAC